MPENQNQEPEPRVQRRQRGGGRQYRKREAIRQMNRAAEDLHDINEKADKRLEARAESRPNRAQSLTTDLDLLFDDLRDARQAMYATGFVSEGMLYWAATSAFWSRLQRRAR